jgi:hypothetical protein
LLLAAVLVFTNCKKEKEPAQPFTPEQEQATVASTQADAGAQHVFDDVLNNVIGVGELGIGGTGIFGRQAGTASLRVDSLPRCVTVSISPAQLHVFPKTVVMDFGAGCFSHGHLRSGKITTVFTGRLLESGQSATTTFDNFKIDSVTVTGTHKVTNTTATASGQRQLKVDITNGQLTHNTGLYVAWNASRVHTQTEGGNTISPLDDVFQLAGRSTGTTGLGSTQLLAWNTETGETLTRRFTCRWIAKGTIKTTVTGLASGTQRAGVLDFGDGTCDNQAVLSVNGNKHQIVLR